MQQSVLAAKQKLAAIPKFLSKNQMRKAFVRVEGKAQTKLTNK
jgi:hypothetical protein